jgi:hypothetical protein
MFDFLKPFLRDFIPGKIIKEESNGRPALKNNFNYLLKTMAGYKPDFLTKFIFQANPSIDTSTTIPFKILLDTLKLLLTKFTSTLFTKLNYKAIFSSHVNIPPNTISNRTRIALNLARLHLFLNNRFQTIINSTKFFTDINIKPIRLQLHYFISDDSPNKPLFNIQSDSKFNVNVSLNIPKTQFLQNFCIPSLKEYKPKLETWFKSFFEVYKRQFLSIDETKVFNFIKYEIANKLSLECKKLLPLEFEITSISSLTERINLCRKAALHHIHTCKLNQEKCLLLAQNNNNTLEHNFKNINSLMFKQSFEHFNAPPKNDNETRVKWVQPTLDFSIFKQNNEYEATFATPTPTAILQELANQAEQKFTETNETPTNIKRKTFYFYTYLKAYLQNAAINNGISNLNLDQALKKAITKSSDAFFLARIISYFDTLNKNNISINEIRKNFNETHLPLAEQFITEHFKFTTPLQVEDNLFLNTSDTLHPF